MEMGKELILVGTCSAIGDNFIDVKFIGFYQGQLVRKVRAYYSKRKVDLTPSQEIIAKLKTISLINEVLETHLIKLKVIE